MFACTRAKSQLPLAEGDWLELEDRFAEYSVTDEDGCKVWTGGKSKAGYGRVQFRHRHINNKFSKIYRILRGHCSCRNSFLSHTHCYQLHHKTNTREIISWII